MVIWRQRLCATEAEDLYNKTDCKIRSGVERCLELLKYRFRRLKRTSGHLHYTHKKAANIIGIFLCGITNILINNNYPINNIDVCNVLTLNVLALNVLYIIHSLHSSCAVYLDYTCTACFT